MICRRSKPQFAIYPLQSLVASGVTFYDDIKAQFSSFD